MKSVNENKVREEEGKKQRNVHHMWRGKEACG